MKHFGSFLLALAWLLPVGCGGKAVADLFGDGGTPDASQVATTGAGGATGSGTTGSSGSGVTGTAGAGGDGSTVGTGGAATGGASGGSGGGEVGGAGTAGRGGASGGNAGAGGSSGGAAGTSGGSGGSQAGAGGAAGSGGKGGAAGGPAQPECTTAADCKLLSDCCTCQAVAAGEVVPPCPPIACLQTKCMELRLPADSVACVAGRCVAGFDCDARKVTCRVAVPQCQPGFVPVVEGSCYTGACVPATECLAVSSCAACIPGTPCAMYGTQLGLQFHCVTIPSSCNGSGTCACMGPATCIKPFATCTDLSGIRGINCSCPTCS